MNNKEPKKEMEEESKEDLTLYAGFTKGMKPPKNDSYERRSHEHCFLNLQPPCGLKGVHCCLCDIVTSGEASEHVPNMSHSSNNGTGAPKEEKCYSCGGKGTYSQIHGDHGAEDFGGEGYENKPSIHNYPCRACNGTGVKPKEEKCKSSPLCSHNTNGRNMNKPCSIAISSSPTLEETEQKCFEANILDGDDINDCGGAMVSAKEAFSYMLERIRAAREEGLIHGRKECYRDMADLDKILVGENFDEWYEKLSQKVKEAPFIHIAFKHGLDQMYKKGRSAALEEAKGILLKSCPCIFP